MTRDNATSRALGAAGCMVAMSALTETAAGAETGHGTPAAGWSLAAALLGFFMVTLDAVIVNVALPNIRQGPRQSAHGHQATRRYAGTGGCTVPGHDRTPLVPAGGHTVER